MIRLGYEIGSGKAIDIPGDRHVAISGQTQRSGKTTTLEALIHRSKLRAVAFVTKRAEGSFRSAVPIAPYFRDSADWQFVSSILEAMLGERMKFERAWIIDACKGAKGLADVLGNVQERLHGAKVLTSGLKVKKRAAEKWRIKPAQGLNRSVLTTLEAYLQIVIPEIQRLPYTKTLDLAPGLNVMDLSEYSTELQQLVIRSVLEWVYEQERDTVVVIPEAWEFIPQNRRSPVLLAAEELIRKGAAAGNFVWLDSQDIAGVHKNVLRSVGVWILGVQRELNEVKRTLGYVQGAGKITPEQVMALGKGQFFAAWDQRVARVYVQPFWIQDTHAEAIARGEEPVESAEKIWREQKRNNPQHNSAAGDVVASAVSGVGAERGQRPEGQGPGSPAASQREPQLLQVQIQESEDEMEWKERAEQAESEVMRLRQEVARLMNVLRARGIDTDPIDVPVAVPAPPTNGHGKTVLAIVEDADYERLKLRLLADSAVLVALDAVRPELRLHIERPVVQMDNQSIKGRLALLAHEGFFKSPTSANDAMREFKRRGWADQKAGCGILSKAFFGLTTDGILTNEDAGYQLAPGCKITRAEA